MIPRNEMIKNITNDNKENKSVSIENNFESIMNDIFEQASRTFLDITDLSEQEQNMLTLLKDFLTQDEINIGNKIYKLETNNQILQYEPTIKKWLNIASNNILNLLYDLSDKRRSSI